MPAWAEMEAAAIAAVREAFLRNFMCTLLIVFLRFGPASPITLPCQTDSAQRSGILCWLTFCFYLFLFLQLILWHKSAELLNNLLSVPRVVQHCIYDSLHE